jgi:hypothetical protein
MKFALFRCRESRVAHAVTVVAVLSFVFLLHPYCEIVDTAEAAPVIQKNGRGADQQVPDNPAHGDTCPSLDHTPVVGFSAFLPRAPHAPPNPPLARTADLAVTANIGWWEVTPHATPPPIEPFPLYLRYAHLLI